MTDVEQSASLCGETRKGKGAKGAEIKQTRGTRVEEEVMIRVKGTYVGPYRQSFSLFFSIQEKDYLGQTRNLISAFKRYY